MGENYPAAILTKSGGFGGAGTLQTGQWWFRKNCGDVAPFEHPRIYACFPRLAAREAPSLQPGPGDRFFFAFIARLFLQTCSI